MGANGVIDLLTKHNEGPYSESKVLNYMNERMRQIGAINKFYERTLDRETPQIGVYTKADIPRAILSRELVFVLSVAVLPNLEEDDYLKFDKSKTNNYWYNNQDIVGKISDAWKRLRDFFDYNNYKRDSDFFIKFIERDNDKSQ